MTTSAQELTPLKSEHLWDGVEQFTKPRPGDMSIPDWVARAMLEDLRTLVAALAAERERNATLTARVKQADGTVKEILAVVVEEEARLQAAERWEAAIYHLNNGDMSISVDDLALTIGRDNTALATFVWPQEGQYAVMQRRVDASGKAT